MPKFAPKCDFKVILRFLLLVFSQQAHIGRACRPTPLLLVDDFAQDRGYRQFVARYLVG